MHEGNNMGIMTTFKKPTLESPEAGGGKGEGEELGVVAGPTHPHPNPPPSRGREKKGRFRKNLPQKGPSPPVKASPGRKGGGQSGLFDTDFFGLFRLDRPWCAGCALA